MTNPDRPAWVPNTLYLFQDRYLHMDGSEVHYVDEGSGPTLLLLQGNPTWSFLYRKIIIGLRGIGLPRLRAIDGTLRVRLHAGRARRCRLAARAGTQPHRGDDDDAGLGGPIGFSVATRQPQRFTRFVVGNTWAWPKSDIGTQAFSKVLGSPLGRYLIDQRNFFVETILPGGVRRRRLSDEEMNAYRGPFPTPQSRRQSPFSRAKSLAADHS